MTRQLSRLAPPNTDLAVDRDRRVYKLRNGVWKRLDYVLEAEALMLAGKSRSVAAEVSA